MPTIVGPVDFYYPVISITNVVLAALNPESVRTLGSSILSSDHPGQPEIRGGCYGRVVAKPKAKTAAKPAKKLPTKAVKPARPGKPSLPLPPPPPPPPPTRDELTADRDVARLLRYGEKFGTRKLDIRMLPLALPIASGALAVCDPAVAKSFKVFDRPTGAGVFRVMLSVARDEAGKEQLAAVIIHVGRPPIARWSVAHAKGQRAPKSTDQIPHWSSTGSLALIDAGSGAPGVLAIPPSPAGSVMPLEIPLTDGRRALAFPSGDGEFAAYWAIDAADKPVCLVVDFDVFTQKEWKAKPT